MIERKSAVSLSSGLRNLGRRLWYALSIIVNVALLIVIGIIVPLWNQNFIVDTQLDDWLPFFYAAVAVNILIYGLLLGFEPNRLRPLLESIADVFTIIALFTLIAIFPFDFSDTTLADIVKLSLWLTILGIGTALAMDMKQWVLGNRPQQPKLKRKNSDDARVDLA